MTVYELLLSDGTVVVVEGISGRHAALSYADEHHAEFVQTGSRVVHWRMRAVDRYVPKAERAD